MYRERDIIRMYMYVYVYIYIYIHITPPPQALEQARTRSFDNHLNCHASSEKTF